MRTTRLRVGVVLAQHISCDLCLLQTMCSQMFLMLAVLGALADATCNRQRAVWDARTSATSDHNLIIGAGEGTTGTRWLFKVVVDALGSRMTTAMHFTHIEGRDRTLAKNALDAMMNLAPSECDDFDYRVFDSIAYVSDTPIPQFFPYIFKAYPRAKVILTVRNGSEWARSRINHEHLAPPPFHGATEGLRHAKCERFYPNLLAAAAYEAYNSMVQCLVPPSQLLVVNVFSESNESVRRKVAKFLASRDSQ